MQEHTVTHRPAIASQRELVTASLMLSPRRSDRQFEASHLPRIPRAPMTPKMARASMLNVAAAIYGRSL